MGNLEPGKEEYRFTIINPQQVEQIVKEWIKSNNFEEMNENNEVYYRIHSIMLGDTFFEYSIDDMQLTMRAHIGSHAKPLRFPPLVNVTVLGTQNYRELLFPLLYLLSSSDISTGNNIAENIPQEPAQNTQPMQSTGAQPQSGTTGPSAIPGQAAEAFNDAAKKRKMRIIIFIIIAIILATIMLIPQILEINSL